MLSDIVGVVKEMIDSTKADLTLRWKGADLIVANVGPGTASDIVLNYPTSPNEFLDKLPVEVGTLNSGETGDAGYMRNVLTELPFNVRASWVDGHGFHEKSLRVS